MPYKDEVKQRQVVSASVKRYRERHGNNWALIETVTPQHISNVDIAESIRSHLADIIATFEERKTYDYSEPSQRASYDKCSNKLKEKRKRVERWLKVLREQRKVDPATLGLNMAEIEDWLSRGKRK
jgi:replicative superfamily II helicase